MTSLLEKSEAVQLMEKARHARPAGRAARRDVWGDLMPIMRVLINERKFNSESAARWLEEQGVIEPGSAGLVAVSWRQRLMRQRRRNDGRDDSNHS
jgi:hypothetical protein